MKKFSVILTYYQKAKLLSRALYCLSQQNYRNFEVVIVFDGECREGVWMYEQFREAYPLKELPEFCKPIVIKGTNKYHYGNSCRRAALDWCDGEYVCWFGHDNFIDKDYLETHAQQIRDDCCVSVVTQQHFSNHEHPDFYVSYRGCLPPSDVPPRDYKVGDIDLLNYAVPLDVAKKWAFPESHWGVYEADWHTFDSILKGEPDLEVRVSPKIVCGHF